MCRAEEHTSELHSQLSPSTPCFRYLVDESGKAVGSVVELAVADRRAVVHHVGGVAIDALLVDQRGHEAREGVEAVVEALDRGHGGGAEAGIVRRQHVVALGERRDQLAEHVRSEEHTSELQSLMRISYAVFCLKTKIRNQ